MVKQPGLFFGFWGQCTNLYRETEPHNGYKILEKWVSQDRKGYYVYTSNVDGHFRRYDKLSQQLAEIHGCATEWVCAGHIGYTQQESELRPRCGKEWEMFNRDRLRCRSAPAEHPEFRFDVPQTLELEASESTIAGEGVSWEGPVPTCCTCGKPCRPAVILFDETDVALIAHTKRSADRYQAWEHSMEAAIADDSAIKIVVLELGCGDKVKYVRDEMEWVWRDAKDVVSTRFIRVNPDGGPSPDMMIQAGALQTLETIDKYISEANLKRSQ